MGKHESRSWSSSGNEAVKQKSREEFMNDVAGLEMLAETSTREKNRNKRLIKKRLEMQSDRHRNKFDDEDFDEWE